MKRVFIRCAGFFVLTLWGLASCTITSPYGLPKLRTEDLYRAKPADDTTTLATLPYSQLFSDTLLQELIREGLAQNLDIQVAYTRIRQAEAYYAQSAAAFLPTLSANAGITESRLSIVQGFGIRTRATQYQLGLSSSWVQRHFR